MNRRRVGIKEVAAAAGVSVTTVSHALNDKGRLPDSTREQVKRVAAELGYLPSAAARNLVVGRTGLVGIAISQDGTPAFALADFAYFGQLMMAASRVTMASGYALVLTPVESDIDPRGDIAVDGAIIVDPVRGDRLVSRLLAARVPVVTTGRIPEGSEQVSWVDNDHVAGTFEVLDHLAARGARRVALITPPISISYTADVDRAYREWSRGRGQEPLIKVCDEDLTESAGIGAADQLFDLEDPPDAVFTTYDRLAFGTLLAANARGIEVPRDLLVASTATESQAPEKAPLSLSTLELDPAEIGRNAAALLLELLDGAGPDPREIVVPHRVIPRDTTNRVS